MAPGADTRVGIFDRRPFLTRAVMSLSLVLRRTLLRTRLVPRASVRAFHASARRSDIFEDANVEVQSPRRPTLRQMSLIHHLLSYLFFALPCSKRLPP